jgi:hypothetical protein
MGGFFALIAALCYRSDYSRCEGSAHTGAGVSCIVGSCLGYVCTHAMHSFHIGLHAHEVLCRLYMLLLCVFDLCSQALAATECDTFLRSFLPQLTLPRDRVHALYWQCPHHCSWCHLHCVPGATRCEVQGGDYACG